MSAPTRPVLPVTDDVDTAGFWAAAREHRLVIRWCRGCGAWLHLPRAYCPRCHTFGDDWRDVEGRGRLYSWTTVEHQVHPGHPTPYTVVLVELDDVPEVRLLGSLPGRPALVAGMPMVARYEEIDGAVLPQWSPADGPDGVP